MPSITIQQGHVPRTSGATGAYREQEFVKLLAPKIKSKLVALGYDIIVIGADDPAPADRDIFISLHTDGSGDPDRRGASVGYPGETSAIATAWKNAHREQGYDGPFLGDNYTRNLAGYYMWRRTNTYTHRFLAEHGFTTNPKEADWLFSHLDECAKAHVDAIRSVAPPPNNPTDYTEEDMIIEALIRSVYNQARKTKLRPYYDVAKHDPDGFSYHLAGAAQSDDPVDYVKRNVASVLAASTGRKISLP